MTLRDFPRTPAVWTTPTDSVLQVSEMMTASRVTLIPVVAGGRTIGVVTDRDVEAAFGHVGLDPAITPVSAIMSRPAIEVEADADEEEAVRTMLAYRVHSVVLSDKGRFAGVVSLGDLAARMPGRDLSAALAYLDANARGMQAPRSPEIYIG